MNPKQEKALLVVKLLSMQGYDKEIRKRLMSKIQLKIFMFIKGSPNATANEISIELNLCLATVYTALGILCKKSFLKRVRALDSTGGYKYHLALNTK